MTRAISDNGPGSLVAGRGGLCEGILTTAELYACGLSRGGIRTRVRHGTLHRIHQGVYAIGHANLSPLAECIAAVKACGRGAVLACSSAAASVGLLPWDEGLPPEVLLSGTSRPSRSGIRIHRTMHLPPVDLRPLGCIQATAPARTIADLAGRLTDEGTLALVRRAQGKRLVTHRQLLATHQRLGARPGSGRLARAIALGPAPTRSVLEEVVLDLILAVGFARPDVNAPVVIDGRRVIPDFRWPEAHLIVEADGAAWHSGAAAAAASRARRRSEGRLIVG